jgi:Tfp pilus assembly protein PilO
VLATAGLRFVVTGLYQLTSNETWENAAGVIGLLLATFAVYAAYAAEFEDVLKRPLLPFGRRRKGEQAVKGTYAEQFANVSHEPGVRQQL